MTSLFNVFLTSCQGRNRADTPPLRPHARWDFADRPLDFTKNRCFSIANGVVLHYFSCWELNSKDYSLSEQKWTSADRKGKSQAFNF